MHLSFDRNKYNVGIIMFPEIIQIRYDNVTIDTRNGSYNTIERLIVENKQLLKNIPS